MKKVADLDTRNRAKTLYLSGMSCKKVADELGYNELTIRGWLKSQNVELKKGGSYNRKYDNLIINQVIKLYSQGLYSSEIDKKLNLRKGATQYILNKNGIEMRHRGPKSKIEREDFFEEIDTEAKAYFLGYIMADGNVSICNLQYSLKFHVAIQDKEIIDKFLENINSSNKTKYKEISNSYYVSLTSIQMCKSLIQLGVVPNKTGKEYISNDIPKELIRHFLRGVFDGDGITDVKRYRSGFVGSVNMIENILDILEEKLSVFEAGKNKKVVYFLGGKKFSKKLYDYLYSDCSIYLTRKRERLLYICSK